MYDSSSCQDATFFIHDTTEDYTGKYSCVFSVKKYDTKTVKGNGSNSIFIHANGEKAFDDSFRFNPVQKMHSHLTHDLINPLSLNLDSFIPANIAVRQTSVKTGSDVEFQCTSTKLPERNQNGNIYAYLYKNSIVNQVIIWDTTKNGARFTLKEVTMQDAGTYICFLKSEPCRFPNKTHSLNEVTLHITGKKINK